MSLLGRLEDLPVSDILQIVFLSRRTGLLEIHDSGQRHTVLFHRGLIVNASSPQEPDLAGYLEKRINLASLSMLPRNNGIPIGRAAIEMNLLTPDDLKKIVSERIAGVVGPLCALREGEFHFMLAPAVSPEELEYDLETIFGDGGIRPDKILGKNPVRLRSLGGIKESLESGKHLSPPAPPDAETRGHGDTEIEPGSPRPRVSASPRRDDRSNQFLVGSPADQRIEVAPAPHRRVVLFEQDPVVRVAARRAFARKGIDIIQYGTSSDTRKTIADLLNQTRFFVSFLDMDPPDAPEVSLPLLKAIKARNGKLPVVMIDDRADFRRRHRALKAGADLYLTKPLPERLHPTLLEEELGMFAEDLVLFAERTFTERERTVEGDADRYRPAAGKEHIYRGFRLLKQLINEVSDPNDISQLTLTILRMAADYVDRGILFVVKERAFVALGAFGLPNRDGKPVTLTLSREEPSILQMVASTGQLHHGTTGNSPADHQLLTALGGAEPAEMLVLPILNEDEVVGLLYGDNAQHGKPIENTIGLEVFLSQAGFAFRNALIATRTPALPGSAAVLM